MLAGRICSCALLSAVFAVPSIFAQVNGGTGVPRTSNASVGGLPLVAPLSIEDQQRTSVITMVNSAPDGLDVGVVLYDLTGGRLASETVSLTAHSQHVVAVSDLLQGSRPQYGSAFLIPHRNSTMAAQKSIVGWSGASTYDVEEEFHVTTSFLAFIVNTCDYPTWRV